MAEGSPQEYFVCRLALVPSKAQRDELHRRMRQVPADAVANVAKTQAAIARECRSACLVGGGAVEEGAGWQHQAPMAAGRVNRHSIFNALTKSLERH